MQQYSRPADKFVLIHDAAQFWMNKYARSLWQSRSIEPQIIAGEFGKCLTIASRHLLVHCLLPIALHGNGVSCSCTKAGNPFGCSCDPFVNWPDKKTPHVHGCWMSLDISRLDGSPKLAFVLCAAIKDFTLSIDGVGDDPICSSANANATIVMNFAVNVIFFSVN